MPVDAVEQIREGNSEPRGHLAQRVQAQIVLTAFDAADVRPVKARSLGKLFLRQLPLIS